MWYGQIWLTMAIGLAMLVTLCMFGPRRLLLLCSLSLCLGLLH